jgi:hypothetical protein
MVDGQDSNFGMTTEARLSRLEASMEGVVGQLSHISATVDALSSKINEGHKTNWSTYWSGLGVLLAFVVTLGSGALAPLYYMASVNSQGIMEIGVVDDRLRAHELSLGHPTSIAKQGLIEAELRTDIRRNENELDVIESKLRHEIVVSSGRNTELIKSLGETVQREFKISRDHTDYVRMQRMYQGLIDAIKNSKDQHNQEY